MEIAAYMCYSSGKGRCTLSFPCTIQTEATNERQRTHLCRESGCNPSLHGPQPRRSSTRLMRQGFWESWISMPLLSDRQHKWPATLGARSATVKHSRYSRERQKNGIVSGRFKYWQKTCLDRYQEGSK